MSEKIHYKNIEKLFMFTRQTWAKWQNENRPIVNLLGYFNDEDIVELLKNGKIEKMENLKYVQNLIMYIKDIHNAIVEKSIDTDKEKREFSKELLILIFEFRESKIFSNYPDYIFDEFIDFVFNRENNTLKNIFLKIPHKVNKDAFYTYVENIKLIEHYQFDNPYTYNNFIN